MNKKFLAYISIIIFLLVVWVFYKNTNYIQYYVFQTGMPPGYCDPGPCVKINTSEPKAIEKIDFKTLLAKKYETSDSVTRGENCEAGSTSVDSIKYGDVTNDGIEEAVVNYTTCFNGTGGGNSEVYKMDNKGGVINISPDATYNFSADKYKEVFKGYAGHGYFGILNSKLVLNFPVYKAGDPNCCPSGGNSAVMYKWNGTTFVYESVTTTP